MARDLVVRIIGDSRSYERALGRSSRASKEWGRDLSRVARGSVVATVGFRGLGRSVAFASAAFLGGAGFTAGVRAAIRSASDLQEELNKTNVLFGRSARAVSSWSRTTATQIGLSQRAALQAAGNFGAMFETLALGDQVSSEMSRRLVQLGADLASFSNQDPSEMLDRLRSGLAGEAEPLRRFGILISEARVQQEAYASGLAEAGSKLTEQQKVLARFNLILKDSVAAQGDFARTSTSQANQERINAALREEAARRIGQVLLPAYNQATRAVNRWLADEENLARVQKATARALEIGTRAARAFTSVLRTLIPITERVNVLLGGTERTVRLLVLAFIASKLLRFTGALTGLGGEALIASGRVSALRLALLRLAAIGTIVIGVEVLIQRREIERQVDDFLRSNRLGFLAGPRIRIPVDVDLSELREARARLVEFRGEGDLMVKALDLVIGKFKELDRQRLQNISKRLALVRQQILKTPDKKVRVDVVQRGLEKVQKQLALVKDKTVQVQVLEQGIRELQKKLGEVKGKTIEFKVVERGLKEVRRQLDLIRGKTITITVQTVIAPPGVQSPDTAERSARAAARAGRRAAADEARVQAAGARAAEELERRKKEFAALMGKLGLELDEASLTKTAKDDIAALRAMEKAILAEMQVEGRTAELLGKLVDVRGKLEAFGEEAAAAALAMADSLLDALRLKLDRARVTRTLVDDLRALREIEGAIKRRIQAEGRTTELLRELFEVRQERVALLRQQTQAAQFKALGLTETGEARIPSARALRRRVSTLSEQIKGTFLDTQKTRSQLQRIAKVLSGAFGNVGREVRESILRMLQDISGALAGTGIKGPLTKFRVANFSRLFKDIGLDPEELKKVRQIFSRIGPGGTTPFPTRTGGAFGFAMPALGAPTGSSIVIQQVVVENPRDFDAFVREVEKRSMRRAGSRSGTRAGN